jgi:hypothetical protein
MIKDLEHKKAVAKAKMEERAMRRLSYEEALQKLDSYDNGEMISEEDTIDILPAISKVHENDVVDDNWDDFGAMLEDIKKYTRETGNSVVLSDKPMQLRIGYACSKTNRSWSCKIRKMREYFDKLLESGEEEKSNALRKSFMTQEGREVLLAVLNETLSSVSK